jgi:predicted cobalt transporter CbtA
VGKVATNVLYVVTMVVVIVGVDLLFFRNHTWARLAANVGIVLLAVAFYYRFLNRR